MGGGGGGGHLLPPHMCSHVVKENIQHATTQNSFLSGKVYRIIIKKADLLIKVRKNRGKKAFMLT